MSEVERPSLIGFLRGVGLHSFADQLMAERMSMLRQMVDLKMALSKANDEIARLRMELEKTKP